MHNITLMDLHRTSHFRNGGFTHHPMAQTFRSSLALPLVSFVRTRINQAKEFKTILKMAEKTKFCLWIFDKNWTEFHQEYKEMSGQP